MANLKETIISSMVNGPEVLADIVAMKRNGKDYRIERFQTREIINKYHPDHLMLKVSQVRKENEIAKTIRFVPTKGALPVFEAGQYLNVFVIIDGVRTSRPYSISSSPKQRAFIEITVARIPSGFVSNYFIDNVKVGDLFEANGPAGSFHYNAVFHQKKSVFLAGGSGITPFMSMTREILESGLDREIVLIYGCRTEDIAIFNTELSQLSALYPNFSYHLVLSEQQEGYTGRTGFIDANCIKELSGDLLACTFYMCGPPVMTDFCMTALESLNIKKGQIRREVFGARQDIQNEPAWPSELTGDEVFNLTIGDVVIPAKSSESLLVSLERSGVRVNVCCRSGECSLCRVKLVKGNVFMPRGVLLRLADEKFGYLHSCKAYPIGDVEIAF